MKCISIKQPWASLIFGHEPTQQNSYCEVYREALPKCVENRTWGTQYRGPLLIHASQNPDVEWLEQFFGTKKAEHCGLPTGAILGAVELVGCHQYSFDPDCGCGIWANEDCWHLMLANPVEFAEPIPWKGQLGIYFVPNSVVLDALKEAEAQA